MPTQVPETAGLSGGQAQPGTANHRPGEAADQASGKAQLRDAAARLVRTEDAMDPYTAMVNDQADAKAIGKASIKLNFFLAVALVGSVGLNVFLGYQATNVVREYFALDATGRLIPIVPVSAPYRSSADVIEYAEKTLRRTLNLSFAHWRRELEDVRSRYDDKGFASILLQLQNSGILETIDKKRMNASLSAGTGVVVASGVENGRFVWLVEMPVELTFAGQEYNRPAIRWKATVRVERVATQVNSEAITVTQVITEPR